MSAGVVDPAAVLLVAQEVEAFALLALGGAGWTAHTLAGCVAAESRQTGAAVVAVATIATAVGGVGQRIVAESLHGRLMVVSAGIFLDRVVVAADPLVAERVVGVNAVILVHAEERRAPAAGLGLLVKQRFLGRAEDRVGVGVGGAGRWSAGGGGAGRVGARSAGGWIGARAWSKFVTSTGDDRAKHHGEGDRNQVPVTHDFAPYFR